MIARHCSRKLFIGSVASLALGLAATSAPAIATDAGLVAHWTFDEGAGKTVVDHSGNGNDGTELFPEDGKPHWGTGGFAGALLLSATTNNHVQVPASDSLNAIREQITIAARLYPLALWTPDWKKSGYTVVVQRQWQQAGHPDQYYLGYGNLDGVLYYKWHLGLVDDEIGIYALPAGEPGPVTNDWVDLVATYDGETAALYVNGELIGTEVKSGVIRLDAQSMERPIAIGAEINGENVRDTVGELNAYFDEVRIYDRALGADEVRALSATPSGPLR